MNPELIAMLMAGSRPQEPQPDTLSGPQRKAMMEFLHRMGGDTASMSQEGIQRMLDGSLLDSLGTAYNNPNDVSVKMYFKPTNQKGYVHKDRRDEININAAYGFLPDTDANIMTTQHQRDMSPEDRIRQTILHEFGHASGVDNEYYADSYAAAFDALSRAADRATVGEVAQDAAHSYWNNANAYKARGLGGVNLYQEDGEPVPERVEQRGRRTSTRDHVRALSGNEVFPERKGPIMRWLSELFNR